MAVAAVAGGSLLGGDVALPEPAVSTTEAAATITSADAFQVLIDVPLARQLVPDGSSGVAGHGAAVVVGAGTVVVVTELVVGAAAVVEGAVGPVVEGDTAGSLTVGVATAARTAMIASTCE